MNYLSEVTTLCSLRSEEAVEVLKVITHGFVEVMGTPPCNVYCKGAWYFMNFNARIKCHINGDQNLN